MKNWFQINVVVKTNVRFLEQKKVLHINQAEHEGQNNVDEHCENSRWLWMCGSGAILSNQYK